MKTKICSSLSEKAFLPILLVACLLSTTNCLVQWNDHLPQTIEKTPYQNNDNFTEIYEFTESIVTSYVISFDSQSEIEKYEDILSITYTDAFGNQITAERTGSGRELGNIRGFGNSFTLNFMSNTSVTGWGYKLKVEPQVTWTCETIENFIGHTWDDHSAHVIENSHDYCESQTFSQTFSWSDPSVTGFHLEWDSQSQLEYHHDYVIITYTDSTGVQRVEQFTGTGFSPISAFTPEFGLEFHSDQNGVTGWGYKFTVTPIVPSECDRWTTSNGEIWDDLSPHVVESPHNYCHSADLAHVFGYSSQQITGYQIVFDPQTELEDQADFLTISYLNLSNQAESVTLTGQNFTQIDGSRRTFSVTFTSNATINDWGYKFTVTPIIGWSCTNILASTGETWNDVASHEIESPHPTCASQNYIHNFGWDDSNVVGFNLEWDPQSVIAQGDSLAITYEDASGNQQTSMFTGTNWSSLLAHSKTFSVQFTSTSSSPSAWGYKFTVTPVLACEVSSGELWQDWPPTSKTVSSPHNYCDSMSYAQHYSFDFSYVSGFTISFSNQTEIENNADFLTITFMDQTGQEVSQQFTGNNFSDIVASGNSFSLTFTSNESVAKWGYEFTVTPSFMTWTCQTIAAHNGQIWDIVTIPQVLESSHMYCSNQDYTQHYGWSSPDVSGFTFSTGLISFGNENDYIELTYTNSNGGQQVDKIDTGKTLTAIGRHFSFRFHSDDLLEGWGYQVAIEPMLDSCRSNGETWDGIQTQTIEKPSGPCSFVDTLKHYSFSDQRVVGFLLSFDDDNTDIVASLGQATVKFTDAEGIQQIVQYTNDNKITVTGFGRSFTLQVQYSSPQGPDYALEVVPILSSSCDHWTQSGGETWTDTWSHVLESPHDYCNSINLHQTFSFSHPKVVGFTITFDARTTLQENTDYLTINYQDTNGVARSDQLTGSNLPDIISAGTTFSLSFTSDQDIPAWGYKITVTPTF